MSEFPVVTIDGPSGTGKGTVGRRVAQVLGWHFLDSGALYRVCALAAIRHGVDPGDAAALAELAGVLEAEFDEFGRVLLRGEDVSDELRTESCGNAASRIAALPEVRKALLQWQRTFRRAPGLVADGRDMGTVVFPFARVKFFLTASPGERARRRYNQLKEKGLNVNLTNLSEEIAERDRRDASRAVAPLRPADDAVLLDTTNVDVDGVVEQVLAHIEARAPITR